MKKLLIFAPLIFIIVSMFSGVIGTGHTVQGVRWAYSNGSMMSDGNVVAFLWPCGENDYGVFFMNKNLSAIEQIINYKNAFKEDVYSVTSLTKFLEGRGFHTASREEIPLWMSSSIKSFQMYLLSGMGNVWFPSFMVMPIFVYQSNGWAAPSTGL